MTFGPRGGCVSRAGRWARGGELRCDCAFDRRARTTTEGGSCRSTEPHHTHTGAIDLDAGIGRQDDGPRILGHSLEQIAGLRLCVPIAAVVGRGPLPEQVIGFVEEQDLARCLCSVEHAPEVLLRLADVLAHNL